MNPRPVIFLSAVSKDLRTARGFAARLLHSMGYDPKDQDMARTEHGSLRSVLRKWIDQSEGVIQLVGKCYGAEPVKPDGTPRPDAEFARCSYTQFEAFYAREKKKPVWYFFVGDGFTADAHEPESPDLAALQQRYIAGIHDANDIRNRFANTDQLENLIGRLKDRLEELRGEWYEEQRRARRHRVFVGIALVLILAVALVGVQLGWWMRKDTGRIEMKVDALTQAATEFIQRNAADTAGSGGKDEATRRTLLFAELEKKHGLKAGTLEKELPDIARHRAEDAAIPKLDRARAAHAALAYAEAERLALEAYAEAKKAVPLDKHKLIEALELAGWSASAHRDDQVALTHFTAASKLTDKAAAPLEWARVHHALAYTLADHGEAARAVALLPEVIAIRKDKLGAEHPETLESWNNLAASLNEQGKNAEAEVELRAVLADMERVLGAEHPDTLMSRMNLGIALFSQAKYPEAEKEFRETAESQRPPAKPEA